MVLNAKQEEFKKDLAKAMQKAWEDESFKKQLLAAPKEAIESLTGRKLNIKDDVNIVVTDQSTPATYYFNLPEKPDVENMELSEDQLEMVAGGGWGGYLLDMATSILVNPVGTMLNPIDTTVSALVNNDLV